MATKFILELPEVYKRDGKCIPAASRCLLEEVNGAIDYLTRGDVLADTIAATRGIDLTMMSHKCSNGPCRPELACRSRIRLPSWSIAKLPVALGHCHLAECALVASRTPPLLGQFKFGRTWFSTRTCSSLSSCKSGHRGRWKVWHRSTCSASWPVPRRPTSLMRRRSCRKIQTPGKMRMLGGSMTTAKVCTPFV